MGVRPVCPLSLTLSLALCGCVAGTATGPDFSAFVDDEVPAEPPGGGGGEPTTDFDTAVLPLLNTRCAACHVNGEGGAPIWMAGDAYSSLMAYPNLVVPGEPDSSTLITYGAHAGPAWLAAEASVVRTWILEEGGVVEPPPGGAVTPPPAGGAGIATEPLSLVEGPNRIELDGVGLEGAYITFVAMQVALGMHLSDIRIHAAPGRGARLVHPTLVMHDGTTRTPDPDDRFAGVELSIVAGSQANLTTAALLVDFPSGGFLSFEFDSAAPL